MILIEHETESIHKNCLYWKYTCLITVVTKRIRNFLYCNYSNVFFNSVYVNDGHSVLFTSDGEQKAWKRESLLGKQRYKIALFLPEESPGRFVKQPVAKRQREREREREGEGEWEVEIGRWGKPAAKASQRTREFNFSVTLHLRSLIPAALCASRGGAERHSIAGLHLRFSIMEIQRALGANATLFSPFSSFCSVGATLPGPSSVFRGKINKFVQTPTLDPSRGPEDPRRTSRFFFRTFAHEDGPRVARGI